MPHAPAGWYSFNLASINQLLMVAQVLHLNLSILSVVASDTNMKWENLFHMTDVAFYSLLYRFILMLTFIQCSQSESGTLPPLHGQQAHHVVGPGRNRQLPTLYNPV